MRFRPQPLFILFLLFTTTAIGLFSSPRTANAAATMDIYGGVVTYTAGPYIINTLTVTFGGSANFTFQETGETISLGGGATGAGCTGGGTNTVVCPSAAITGMTVNLNDRDDTFTLVASTLPVTVNGGTGNDTITGGDGIDTLNGDAGNDTLVGVKGNDIISGGIGDDTMVWNNGDGSDKMDGNEDNDTVEVNGSNAAGDNFTVVPNGTRTKFDRTNLGLFTLDIDAENLVVNGQVGEDQMTGAAGLVGLINMTFNGGADNDTLTGGDGVDTMNGDAGNDTLIGFKGNDIMSGGEGDDHLIWNNGDGSDTMNGDADNDTVEVNGSDTAGDNFTIVPNGTRTKFDRTNLGLFTLDIDAENLVMNGQIGDDQMTGAAGLVGLINMTFNGGVDNDTLTGGDGVDTMNGDAGNDTLIGFKGNDSMSGGEGDDRLIWNNGDGSDTMNGDADNDTVEVNGSDTAGDIFTIVPNGTRTKFDRTNLGLFTLDIDAENLVMNGQIGDDQMTGAAGLVGFINMTFNGGADNDTLTGGDGVDTMNGDVGNDTLIGFKGNDIISGGEGDDRLIWNNGDGSDTMNGDADNDTVEVNGSDTAGDIFTIVPNGTRTKFDRTNLGLFTLDIDAENLVMNGQIGDDQMTGAAGLVDLISMIFNGGADNDTFTGGDGVDTMNGDAGNDTLIGFKGNDIMSGGEGEDRLIWNNGDGSDKMDGDAGADTVEVNGSDTAGDSFTIAPNGARTKFDRINLGLFTLDMDVETLEVNGQAGNDLVSVLPLLQTIVTLDGGAHDVGDTLTVDLQGAEASDAGGVITVDGHAPINHANFETVTLEEGEGGSLLFLPLIGGTGIGGR